MKEEGEIDAGNAASETSVAEPFHIYPGIVIQTNANSRRPALEWRPVPNPWTLGEVTDYLGARK